MKNKIEIIKENKPEEIVKQKEEQEEMFRQFDESIKNMKIEEEVNYEV